MSHKRKHAELTDGHDDAQKPSRKKHGKSGNTTWHSKGKRSHHSNLEPKLNATNALKSRMRDLRRLLGKVDSDAKYKMPANVRMERERELEAIEHELAEKTVAAREAEYRKKMIGRYHQVRFFDRQKATRILKRLKRELAASEDQSKKPKLLEKIHNAEVAVNYAIYYPLLKPYSSLYPRSKRDQSRSEGLAHDQGPDQDETGSAVAKGDPDMWEAVERAMEAGTLDALRNRTNATSTERVKDDERPGTKKRSKAKTTSASRTADRLSKEANATPQQEKDEESDSDFFE